MKKLLSLLTISTLTASVPAPLLANTALERKKRNVGVSNSNNEYLPLKEINGINRQTNSIAVDSKWNIYFGTNNGLYLLEHGKSQPTKINGFVDVLIFYKIAVDSKDNIYFGTDAGAYKLLSGSTNVKLISGMTNFVQSLTVDSKGNIYFGTNNGLYLLEHGKSQPTKINGINDNILSLAVDSKDNIYFGKFDGAYKLTMGSDTPTKINGINRQTNSIVIDNSKYLYLGTNYGAYVIHSALTSLEWTKIKSQFALIDSTKNMTWTRPDLLSVDGELKIEIINPNIDKVVFDNVQEPQTNKHWTINVKPETAPRDHILQVMFTLDGKQYTSEITVSMQAKIVPPVPPVQENLSDVIKFGDENILGNIIDNNDNTIFSAINQINARQVDFSQITIEKKDDHSATLSAIEGSKSYAGSVVVKYNIVPATVVDLKIDLIPTSSKATIVKDYLGQIDTSNITNPVNTFYYADSESVITMIKPTPSSVMTGVVYGCDDKWNKTSQSNTIDSANSIKLDGLQLNTKEGKYVVELSDNLGHINNVYLQIAPKQAIANYFDTDIGKQFEIWAKANGHDNIRGSSASQLNKLFEESKNWQQLASDSQFASALADWFKTNGKLSSKEPLTVEQIVAQLKTQIPKTITIDEKNTILYDLNKVSFVLNQSEFNPNDKVNITVKYNNATSEQFTLQIKDSNTSDNNKKSGLGIWTILGIALGSIAGLGLLGWLFKKFVVEPFILKPIREKKEKAFVAKTEKDIAQMKKDDEEWEAKIGK